MVVGQKRFGPRDADALVGGMNRRLRDVASVEMLVIAPALSARTRELLAASAINYLDLTGNAHIAIEYPAVLIDRHVGARARGKPSEAAVPGLRGDKAGRLARVLVDAAPPFAVTELEEATGLSRGYVSRVLDSLADQALIRRGARGVVEHVDWSALLRARAMVYDVLRTNGSRRFIARSGARAYLERLVELDFGLPWAVTGSFGASGLAPVTAPSLLLVYADPAMPIVAADDLLSADEGADVIVITASDDDALARTWQRGKVPVVAPSQLVLDCLTGPGRMPAEGDALITWMTANEPVWRAPSLSSFESTSNSNALAEAALQW
jgi:hypothetical protein